MVLETNTRVAQSAFIIFVVFRMCSKSRILGDFGTEFSSFLQCLTSVKIFIFAISEKSVGKKSYKVYIFLAADTRAFQNRFDHVHTTSVEHSVTAQLACVI